MAFKNLDFLLEVGGYGTDYVNTESLNGGAISYSQFVGTLAKDMGSPQADVMHMAVGVSGEAGELLDAVKKYWVYNKPLDLANVIEELGDMEFYMQGMRLLMGVSRQKVLEANYVKLQQRYADGYSDAAAQARADKEVLQVIDMSKLPDPAALTEAQQFAAELDEAKVARGE